MPVIARLVKRYAMQLGIGFGERRHSPQLRHSPSLRLPRSWQAELLLATTFEAAALVTEFATIHRGGHCVRRFRLDAFDAVRYS